MAKGRDLDVPPETAKVIVAHLIEQGLYAEIVGDVPEHIYYTGIFPFRKEHIIPAVSVISIAPTKEDFIQREKER